MGEWKQSRGVNRGISLPSATADVKTTLNGFVKLRHFTVDSGVMDVFDSLLQFERGK